MSDSIDQVASTKSYERRRRLSLLGFVLGHMIAAGLAIWPFTIGFTDYAWPRWQAIFIEALACGQLSVAAIMVAAEWPALSIRISSLAGVLAFWLLGLNLTLTEEYWPRIFAIQTLAVGGLVFAARFFGICLRFEKDNRQAPESRTNVGFSLRQMLLAMTVVSLVLGLGVVVQRLWGDPLHVDFGVYARATIMGWWFAGIAIMTLVAAAAEKRKTILFFGLALLVGVASLAIALADRTYRHSWWSSLSLETYHAAYMWLTCVYAVIVYVSLLVLRSCGMRLKWS